MYPEDRVLIGVINRKRDLKTARDHHWYRVPQARMPNGVNVEYLAFFISGAWVGEHPGVRYYAERQGIELAYRRDLLPNEPDHPHADDVYYKVGLGDLIEKLPPVLNPTRRVITFIYTTWDRFVHAQEIRDLYSENDYFVDRIYHALRDSGIRLERYWDAQARDTGQPAHVRILCENGAVVASPERGANAMFMDSAHDDDKILTAIRAEIARNGGPVTINIPLEGL